MGDLGVNVWLNRRVKSYDGTTVMLNTGEQLKAKTLIWTAGVIGSPIKGLKEESIIKGDRILVNEFNQVNGYENIFAIGDVACMITEEYPEGHPMVAQAAIQQGKLLAKNLIKKINGEATQAFSYTDRGSMATIGRNLAVADLKILNKEYRTQGFFAWLIWIFIHLISIISIKNKLIILLNWMISYISYDKGIRLIMGKKKE